MRISTNASRFGVSLALVLFGGLQLARLSAMDATEMREVFAAGRQAFREGNELAARDPHGAQGAYRKAAMCYDRILREGGLENGRLYYNLGNTWFRMGDLGRAILNYRRAERLIPGDPNLRQNLYFAKSRCVDRIGEKAATAAVQTLLFWHYDLSLRTRSRFFTAAFLLFWCAAGLRLLAPRAVPRWALGLVGAGALLLLASVGWDAARAASEARGVILATEVMARKGDGESYEPSFREPLHAGCEFLRLEARGAWWQVELGDGRRCWIPTSCAEIF